VASGFIGHLQNRQQERARAGPRSRLAGHGTAELARKRSARHAKRTVSQRNRLSLTEVAADLVRRTSGQGLAS